jgi:site-specific DNA-methyltransferase (adenine-specific)
MKELKNKIVCGDCIELLRSVKKPFADLIFADPPFNIGYEYDGYEDSLDKKHYVDWTKDWMKACYDVLNPFGSFFVAIGDNHVADVKKIADETLLELRNWIIWHYTFGQQTKDKFARSHTHILYFVKNPKVFTFNNLAVRVMSDRQKWYNDKRANPEGKLPDDVWNEFPRVCGTFKERTGWHPCQMPESILARIIRVSSKEDGWVLDPFSGSGTTAIVAKKLGRNYTGIELSKEYVEESQKRLKEAGRHPVEGEANSRWTESEQAQLKWLYHETNLPADQLVSNPDLLTLFTLQFSSRIGHKPVAFTTEEVARQLLNMRRSSKLGPLRIRPGAETRKGRKSIKKAPEENLWTSGKAQKSKS